MKSLALTEYSFLFSCTEHVLQSLIWISILDVVPAEAEKDADIDLEEIEAFPAH